MYKQGDVSRHRRLIGQPAKVAWYAYYRQMRFAISDFQPHHHGVTMSLLEEAVKILNSANPEMDERWWLPFPMAVFGTLREGHGNSRRMHVGKIGHHCKAFMPHFVASGLTLNFRKNSSAPFEIYCYESKEWDKMIPGVDNLESFSPSRSKDSMYGYYRTLAWIHILPDDFDNHYFKTAILGEGRDLKLPTQEWEKYQRIPCWVYSNRASNKLSRDAGIDTVIWG